MMKPKVTRKPNRLDLTQDQLTKAIGYGTVKKTGGAWQNAFERIGDSVQTINGVSFTHVTDDDLAKLKKWANIATTGSYQEWSREVLTANNINWP